MAKKTLLQLTQDILSDMTSDLVNSITDTPEAQQVAQIVCTTFEEQFSGRMIPELEGIILLEALADTAHPNYLRLPDNTLTIKWIKYNRLETGDVDYADVTYLEPESFIERESRYASMGNFITVTDFSGAKFRIFNDQPPQFWTSFDDKTIMFDGYNAAKESTLQSSNSMCWGQKVPTVVMEDDWTPPIDDNLFPLLLAEAKSTCFTSLWGTPNPKEEQKAKRQGTRSQKHLWSLSQRKYNRLPDYGRRPR